MKGGTVMGRVGRNPTKTHIAPWPGAISAHGTGGSR